MATDLGAIGLALAAIWFAQRPASRDRTYGYLRLEILAAVVNAVVLFGIAAFVLFEAWQRLSEPPAIQSGLMLVVALVGLAANAISLALLHDAQRESLTMRGAYLEVMGDLAGSVAVIVAALVIAATGWTPADAVASAVIGLLIIPRTWRLLRDAVDVLLEATPKGIDLADVRAHILAATGVADVHDLHAWTITSGVDVLSAHVVLGARRGRALGARRAVPRPVGPLRHRALDLPARDRRPAPPRGGAPRLSVARRRSGRPSSARRLAARRRPRR